MGSLVHSGSASVPSVKTDEPATHTPGPWEVLRIEDVLAIMPDPITGRPDTFLGIATIQEHDGERSSRRVEANARLIASAPQLLEALDRALAALQRLHTDVEALMADSEGVAGLHHNGDVATWDDLAEGGPFSDWMGDPLRAARNAWHDGQNAIAKATGAA